MLLAVLALGAVIRPHSASAGLYDPAYNAPGWTCNGTTPSCCDVSQVPMLIHEMFSGTGLYTGQNDMEQYYYVRTLWPKIEKALQQTADEVRNAATFYVGAVGAMLDGQTLNQSLVALQKQSNDTMQNQTVSEQICRFGTMSRSLTQSQDKARAVQTGLMAEMQARQLLKANMNSGSALGANRMMGRSADKLERFQQFRTKFCSKSDGDGGLHRICGTTTEAQENRDIDVTRSLMAPLTLDVDFSGTSTATKPTPDEQNIFALSSNLYANNLFVNLGKSDFTILSSEGSTEADGKVQKLLDFRSLIAKRGVAQNSFAALAGMKAAGSGGSATYMKEIIKELGLSQDKDLTAAIGDKPSYFAQMDVLTRKLYQSPKFYANLMDSPANVARQQTAMGGIELMQDRDIYESLRRSEMLMSTLLELYVMRQQDKFRDKETK